MTSCDYYRYGLGGKQERINAICVLTLNIINDKVFYVMWWWFALLFCVMIINTCHRLFQCVCTSWRFTLIKLRLNVYLKTNPKRECIESFLRQCRIGDWFVLYQLSKNMRRPFFMSIITSLSYMEEDKVVEHDL